MKAPGAHSDVLGSVPADVGRRAFFSREAWGFSLVEVVVAVGITGFVLVSIFGLLTLALRGTMESDICQQQAMLFSRLAARYQSMGFSNALAASNLPATMYFDFSGVETNAAAGYFRCDVANVTPSADANYPLNYVALLQLNIRWPNPQFTSSNVTVFSISNYE